MYKNGVNIKLWHKNQKAFIFVHSVDTNPPNGQENARDAGNGTPCMKK